MHCGPPKARYLLQYIISSAQELFNQRKTLSSTLLMTHTPLNDTPKVAAFTQEAIWDNILRKTSWSDQLQEEYLL